MGPRRGGSWSSSDSLLLLWAAQLGVLVMNLEQGVKTTKNSRLLRWTLLNCPLGSGEVTVLPDSRGFEKQVLSYCDQAVVVMPRQGAGS